MGIASVAMAPPIRTAAMRRMDTGSDAENESDFSDEILVAADIATPVELQSFSGHFVEDKVVLRWITASARGGIQILGR